MTTLSPIKNKDFAWKIINNRGHEVGVCMIINSKIKIASKSNSSFNKHDIYRLAKKYVSVADICNIVAHIC